MKIYLEEQRFTQWWLHIILIVSFLLPILMLIEEYIESSKSGKDITIELLVVIGSMCLVYGLIYSLRLKTRIDENGIQFRFIPFHFKSKLIPWKEIDTVATRKYNAISEFGGWGMKGGALWRKSKGVAYNVRGEVGIQLVLKSGKKILIGTQKETEVKRVLETYKDKTIRYES